MMRIRFKVIRSIVKASGVCTREFQARTKEAWIKDGEALPRLIQNELTRIG